MKPLQTFLFLAGIFLLPVQPCLAEKVELRKLNSTKDWKTVELIEQATAFPEKPWTYPVIKKILKTGTKFIAVTIDDAIVGYAAYRISKQRIWIARIAVVPHRRRQKVGSHLLDHLKRIARDKNAPVVELEVPENNLPVQLLLSENGFKAVVGEPRGEEDLEDSYYFRYQIPGGLTYYEYLGVAPDATQGQLDTALEKAINRPGVTDNEAYVYKKVHGFLSHPDKRSQYDGKYAPVAEPRQGYYLRLFRNEDASDIRKLENALSKEPWSDGRFSDALFNHRFMIIEADGQFAGYCIYRQGNKRLFIEKLAISPEFDTKALWTTVLDQLKKEAFENDLKGVRAPFEDLSRKVRKFFKTQGFDKTGKHTFKDGCAAHLAATKSKTPSSN